MRRPVRGHGGHWILRIGASRIGPGERIDEGHDVSAAQGELIDRELQRRWQILRVYEHQDAHVRIDLCRFRIERPDVEELGGLRIGDPRVAHLSRLLVESFGHGHAGQPCKDRLLRIRELIDELDDVVLEKFLLGGIEKLDGLVSVGRVGAGKSEVERARGADRCSPYAKLGRAILILGRRLRVDHMQLYFTAGA